MNTEQLCYQLANNLRNGVITPESVCEVLGVEENKNILEVVITYLFNTQQYDLIKLLYATGKRLEHVEYLEKCWEL